MYELKKSPSDFIVKEIDRIELKENGRFLICRLKKTNYTTIRAVEQVAKELGKGLKEIGYAGTKDKNAVTEQLISIKNCGKEKVLGLYLKDIEIAPLGFSDAPLSLGDLQGNEFTITVRNISEDDITKIEEKAKEKQYMPNYFGEQRFSKDNVDIGKCLLKGLYKEAVNHILSSNSDYKNEISNYALQGNYPAALRVIPRKLLLLYLHAYQSYIWNKTLTEYVKKNKENISIPVVGFGTETENNELAQVIDRIMSDEKITYRNFINKSIPELSSEGALRDAFVEIEELEAINKGEDFITLKFKLKKGSYATVAIAYLFDRFDSVLKDFI